VVEHRQEQRLQDDRLGEGPLDDEHRRRGEVELALGVAPHVAGEPVVGEPVARRVVDDAPLAQPGDGVGVEAEVLEGVEQAPGARHDAVAPTGRQPAREQLEHGVPVRGAVGERRLQHRELVVVGEECRGHLASVGPRSDAAPPRGRVSVRVDPGTQWDA
jgi:hypothetical protein